MQPFVAVLTSETPCEIHNNMVLIVRGPKANIHGKNYRLLRDYRFPGIIGNCHICVNRIIPKNNVMYCLHKLTL